jgi:hypothetical protein
MASIRCGKCKKTHHSVEVVKFCYAGQVFPCDWLVRAGYDEDGQQIILECGADAVVTGRGFQCEAGHEHVTAEARTEEGWEYAEDRAEALGLVKAGVHPVQMDGHEFV